MTDHPDSLTSWIALKLIPGIGPLSFDKLQAHFGSPDCALAADHREVAQIQGITKKVAKEFEQLDRSALLKRAEKEIKRATELGVRIISLDSEEYPVLLKEIHNPPPLLYIKGELLPEDLFALAVVGTRRTSTYGQKMTIRLVAESVRLGLTIVSGMARGIDTVAHQAALANGGRTIACLGNGLARCYPPENDKLMEQIAENGAVISELPLDTAPEAANFPARNRLISGFSLGTLVTEAPARSGALITANFAVDHGREVFALPGAVGERNSAGPNKLIKLGAQLTESGEDIKEALAQKIQRYHSIMKLNVKQVPELSGEPTPVLEPPPPDLQGDEQKIYGLLSDEPTALDTLIVTSELRAAVVNKTLLHLELKGLAARTAGSGFARMR